MSPKRRSSASGKNTALHLRKEVVQSSIDLEKDWLKAGLAQSRIGSKESRALEKGKQFKKEVAPRCSKEK